MSGAENHVVEMAKQDDQPQANGEVHGHGGGSGARQRRGFEHNNSDTLLVVATLITALSYQLGSNIPGGYWQDDSNGHTAGDPIMRDKHRLRYWLFMAGSWAGFGSSMLLTLGLLTGVPPRSRFVRYAFIVAYSTLVLTFITSQPRTSLPLDLLLWVVVMAVLTFGISYRRLDKISCWFGGEAVA